MAEKEPLFTARFFTMCAFSFTVFASAFMLLPTAPYRILSLGGSESAAGLFLGFLTYASAFTAPVTGALSDHLGKRRMLLGSSLMIALFSAIYAFADTYRLLLSLVPVHGVFWSALLSASAAQTIDVLPESRRAEGIGYWGMSTVLAIAIAPSVGFSLLRVSWRAVCLGSFLLNLAMAAIAALLIRDLRHVRPAAPWPRLGSGLVEWRVALTSLALLLYSFGYGAVTSFSALYAESIGVAPKSIYFIVLSVVVLATRPFSGPFADRVGHRSVFLPSLALIGVGLCLLALSGTRLLLVTSAVVFGCGFGTAYPTYVAYVMRHVTPARRGAAFGAILWAFDSGIGTGSILSGWLIQHFGFEMAFGVAALLSMLSIPYFLFAERRYLLA
jgi:MFS family permease